MLRSKKLMISGSSLAQLNEAIVKIESELNVVPKHPLQHKFGEICCKGERFRPKEAISILLDDHKCNGVFKNVLFAGFCGWVLDPTDYALINFFIGLELKRSILRGDKYLDDYEEYKYSIGLESISRYILVGQDFDEDIFREFGGDHVLFYQGGEIDVENYLDNDKKTIWTIAYCMKLIHNMSSYMASEDKHKVSKNRILQYIENNSREKLKQKNGEVKEPFDALSQDIQGKSKVNSLWSRNKESLAYIYSAATLKTGANRTLLDELLSGEIDAAKGNKYTSRWLRKAVYFYEKFLLPLDEAGFSEVAEFTAGLVRPAKFLPKKLSDAEASAALSVLIKRNKSAL